MSNQADWPAIQHSLSSSRLHARWHALASRACCRSHSSLATVASVVAVRSLLALRDRFADGGCVVACPRLAQPSSARNQTRYAVISDLAIPWRLRQCVSSRMPIEQRRFDSCASCPRRLLCNPCFLEHAANAADAMIVDQGFQEVRGLFRKAQGDALAQYGPDTRWQQAPEATAEPRVEASKPCCAAHENTWTKVEQQAGFPVGQTVKQRLVLQLVRHSVDCCHIGVVRLVVVRDAVAGTTRCRGREHWGRIISAGPSGSRLV